MSSNPLLYCNIYSDLHRSRAAIRVADWAKTAGFGLYHYEYRSLLEPPEEWLGSDWQYPSWQNGQLAEHKYANFRHDNPIGSFHPAHRNKWTSHELLHCIVGWGWWPGQSRLEMALCAALAEVLPVALWYFFDEADCHHCERHELNDRQLHSGALFRDRCLRCEAASRVGPTVSLNEHRYQQGLIFIDEQLKIIADIAKTGQLRHYRYGPIDLLSDGMKYAANHAERLQSDTFIRFQHVANYHGFRHASISDFIKRIQTISSAIIGEKTLPLPSISPLHWQRVDVGWRIAEIAHQTEGECQALLWQLIDDLLAKEPVSFSELSDRYLALLRNYELPPIREIMEVGYPLDGTRLGLATKQVEQGLVSCVPTTLRQLATIDYDLSAFFAHDISDLKRLPLATRFADYLTATLDEKQQYIAQLAHFEAALCGPHSRDETLSALGWRENEPFYLSPSCKVIISDRDLLALIDGDELTTAQIGPKRAWVIAMGDGALELCEIDSEMGKWLQALTIEQAYQIDDLPEVISPEVIIELAGRGVFAQ